LDEYQQPVPLCVPGELYIGGPNLARGYLNRPDLTQQKFVPHPFQNSHPFVAGGDTRLYRTGDLARYQPDGNIVFLGRVDNQVKIRGFRVELDEIEANLRQLSQVDDAIVLIHKFNNQTSQIIAYIVPEANETQIGGFRRQLADKLPDFMIPAVFIPMTELPLTPNGKVDREQLPDPEPYLVTRRQHVAPRDMLEARLVRIWEQVLGVQPISVLANYFELGGHSLQAVTLFAHIEKELKVDLPLTTLFKFPTVAQIADVIRQQDVRQAWQALVPIQPNGTRPPFFCVHGGAGHVFHYRELSAAMGDDQPFYGVQPEGWDQSRVD
ncbi:MAG: AMP-binding protein, partial [Anaerolineales bacterium]|nr:AMP-binding protein [Anaerolineales bacterium]